MNEIQARTLVRQFLTVLAVSGVVASSAVQGKEGSVLVTAEMRAHAVDNVANQTWAKDIQAGAVAAAKPWVSMTDEQIAAMVTSQELPRAAFTKAGVLYANQKPGCPKCGEKILRFGEAWRRDPQGKPWKLQCPSCSEIFPKNDFAAFYPTALDEHGMFRRSRGDRSLLFNAEHPDPKDPLHKLYVDDGYGMRDEQGNVHHMIARYNDAGWQAVLQAVSSLANAYIHTNDVRYAHKGAVLLDRIADVYPEMDYTPLHGLGFQHSQGGSGRGRIVGCIAECFVGKDLAKAYDHIYDGIRSDQELVEYDRQKAARYALPRRESIAEICRHIEDRLILEILRSCKDGRIAGNLGMTHTCAAVAAIALDRPEETPQWLDWLFQPEFPGWGGPGGVPWLLTEGLDADGMGGECGGYGLIWSRSLIELAELLAAYPRYRRHDMIRQFPKLKQCFFVESRLLCLDAVIPPIGDSGATGQWGRPGDALRFAQGFQLYGDPRLAELAWRYAGGNAGSLRRPADIFHEASASLADRIAAAAAGQSTPPLTCSHMGRYGQAVLQTPDRNNGRALWIHYGYGKGHSHADALSLGLYAKNIDMLPDLGYPAYTGNFPERIAWTSNTISHNTLLIDDAASQSSPGGKIGLFIVAPPLRVIDVSSPKAYPKTSLYRRQTAMIDVGDADSYVVDVFRAKGGTKHRLSWHGPASTATVEGVELVRQPRGTLAGPDAELGLLDGSQGKAYLASGFTYLYDVERSQGPVERVWTADWKAEDLRGRIRPGSEPHLRLHALTPCDEVALASGDPPQNKSGNPRRLRYVIQSRLGQDKPSQFVTVLEPYDRQPFIRQARPLKTEHSGDADAVAAVAIELAGGETDVVVLCREPLSVKVEGGIELDGQVGMVRFSANKVQRMRMANARTLKAAGEQLACPTPAYRGKVTRVDASNPQDHRVFLDPPLPPNADMVGKTVHFGNSLPWDTSFEIAASGSDWISTGEISIVSGFKIAADFQSGHKYAVNPGDPYIIPIAAALDR
ncbi:MAG: heparinase II/III family protein [Pirellulales bacterium]|nr:heparinase II/III family protein [Pirellulales bacterium]